VKEEIDESFEELLDEIKENARRDRKRLEKVCDDLLAAGGNAEEISMVSDSLTKSNAQLLELAKLKAKKADESETDESFSQGEQDELFNDISKSKENSN
jgi:hypothetical protein